MLTALKEAAMKNAEAAILEKYSQEIKETVDSMLSESPEDDAPLAATEPPTQSVHQVEQEPEASGAGKVILDLSELEKMAKETMAEEDRF